MFDRSCLLVVTSAALFALAIPLASSPSRSNGQPPEQAPPNQTRQDQPQPPTFHTEANYVRVDVYPTVNGKPVIDLKQDEFEIYEDGVLQKIDAFEHVVVRPAGPQEARREPNNVRESRAELENSRARVFVLFLDLGHVELASSRTIRKPLVDALDGIIGQDDLVGVMTPEMSASNVTFARRTTTIEGILGRYWWGERDRLNPVDPVESQYVFCYPNPSGTGTSAVAQEMIERRREKLALDSLEDLVVFLRGVREERKAILAITDGWRLFRPNQALLNATQNGGPQPPPLGLDPRTGKLSTKNTANPGASVKSDCDVDRMSLAMIDDDVQFRRLLDEANRANASFYPVDPRGLAVFDSPIGPNPPPPLVVDAALLKTRAESLRTLALNTDGTAVLDSNDLAGGLKRIVDDLTSYYLLGYYSGHAPPDGKYHSIKVRVRRPGVQVRARRGYLAATPAEFTTRAGSGSSSRAPSSAVPPLDGVAAAETRAIEAAVAALAAGARDVPLHVQAVAGWKQGSSGPQAVVWTVGEASATDDWKAGGEVDVMLTSANGSTLATSHARIAPGSHSFLATLVPSDPLVPGEYVVLIRGRGAASSAAPITESVRVALAATSDAMGAILIRRGPSTGNREVPTADVRFRRGDQVRAEVPAPASSTVSARLLDRTGKPLNVPVAAAVREEPDGARWHTAQLALAPLAIGDYILEITTRAGTGSSDASGARRTLVAFKVVQ
jgi:VWFA-related protein